MKLLCLIDSLTSGGAQRQLCTLAVGLKKRGYEVRFLAYHPHDHFLPLLQAADIPCQVIPPCSHWQRALAIRRILRQGWQDVVLAFLEGSSFYAEMASIPRPRWGLVIGERAANPGVKSGRRLWLRHFHRLTDAVVCNSHTNRLMLETAFPFLRRKLCTVYNMVDLKLFRTPPDEVNSVSRDSARAFRIVTATRYHQSKNMAGVAEMLLLLKRRQSSPPVVVDWFGYIPSDPMPFKKIGRFVAENGLGASLRLHPAIQDIAGEYSHADVVGLLSFFEGLPNVVCEGMASGKPILLSNVCDAGNLVQDGKNGFLCDPGSPEDMAEKIHRLVALSELERRQMGLESRKMAERLFAEDIVIERYKRILTAAAHHEPLPADCSWPTDVPESATRTVERWVRGA